MDQMGEVGGCVSGDPCPPREKKVLEAEGR